MITNGSIKAGYATSVSRNILTWQQVQAKESPSVVLVNVKEHFESKKAF